MRLRISGCRRKGRFHPPRTTPPVAFPRERQKATPIPTTFRTRQRYATLLLFFPRLLLLVSGTNAHLLHFTAQSVPDVAELQGSSPSNTARRFSSMMGLPSPRAHGSNSSSSSTSGGSGGGAGAAAPPSPTAHASARRFSSKAFEGNIDPEAFHHGDQQVGIPGLCDFSTYAYRSFPLC